MPCLLYTSGSLRLSVVAVNLQVTQLGVRNQHTVVDEGGSDTGAQGDDSDQAVTVTALTVGCLSQARCCLLYTSPSSSPHLQEIPVATKEFTHLHVHTEYSMLDGAARLGDLFTHAKELGMKSMATSDHGFLFGAFDFWRQAKAHDLSLIHI